MNNETLTKTAEDLAVDRIVFTGHPMVLATHPTTIEITKEHHLSRKGDCIVGVSADKGLPELLPRVRKALRTDGSSIALRMTVGGEVFMVKASGDSRLSLSHPTELVVRKSEFLSNRTLAIRSSAAAKDIPRTLVEKLKMRAVGVLEVRVSIP